MDRMDPMDPNVLADLADRMDRTGDEDMRQLLLEIRELLIHDRRPVLAELPGLAVPQPCPTAMGPFVMLRRAAM